MDISCNKKHIEMIASITAAIHQQIWHSVTTAYITDKLTTRQQ